MTLTPTDLDALIATATKAQQQAPGPWTVDWCGTDEHDVDFIHDANREEVVVGDSGVYAPRGDVARHIAAFSPDVALELITAARAHLASVEAHRASSEIAARAGTSYVSIGDYERALYASDVARAEAVTERDALRAAITEWAALIDKFGHGRGGAWADNEAARHFAEDYEP